MRRRTLLAVLPAAALGAAGCLESGGPGTAAEERRSPTTTATSERDQPTATYGSSTAEWEGVRCRGEPIAVAETVPDERGYDDEFEYFPSNGTVRYVAVENGEEAVRYGEMSFERWASMRCANVAERRVESVTAERLGSDEFWAGIRTSPESASAGALVVEVIATPDSVSRSKLADAAPRSVDVTVSIEGDAFSRSVSVFASQRGELEPTRITLPD